MLIKFPLITKWQKRSGDRRPDESTGSFKAWAQRPPFAAIVKRYAAITSGFELLQSSPLNHPYSQEGSRVLTRSMGSVRDLWFRCGGKKVLIRSRESRPKKQRRWFFGWPERKAVSYTHLTLPTS